jgi:hypothetical protein
MTLSDAILPVRIEIGKPDGLNVHWPAWTIPGIGVRIELRILGSLFSAGMESLVNAHPVMAPSELPVILAKDNGVEENLYRIASLIPG